GDDDVAWQGQVGDARPDGPAVLPYEDVRDRGAYGSVAPELEAQGAARRLLDGQAEALRQRPHGEALYDGAHDDDDEDDVEDVLGAGDAEPQRDYREDDGHRALQAGPREQRALGDGEAVAPQRHPPQQSQRAEDGDRP